MICTSKSWTDFWRCISISLLGSESYTMGVFSDDFAAVDFREDYANLSLPKEAKFKRCRTIKTNKEKAMRGGKAAAGPQAG